MKTFKTFSFTALIFCFALFSAFTVSKVSGLQTIYEQKWTSQSYTDAKVQLETPKQLTPMKLEIPQESKSYINKMNAYQFEGEDLMIMLSTVTYKPEITANLKGAAAGAVSEMQRRGGVENFSYENKDTTVAGLPAIIQKGNFKKGKDVIDFNNLITVQGSNLVQVMIAYKAGDAYGHKIREKVFKSVKI